jgi:hypothetical protein
LIGQHDDDDEHVQLAPGWNMNSCTADATLSGEVATVYAEGEKQYFALKHAL